MGKQMLLLDNIFIQSQQNVKNKVVKYIKF